MGSAGRGSSAGAAGLQSCPGRWMGSPSPTGGVPSPPPPPPPPPVSPERMWLHYLDVPFGDASYHLSATFILALVSRSSQGTGVSGLLREQGETQGLV